MQDGWNDMWVGMRLFRAMPALMVMLAMLPGCELAGYLASGFERDERVIVEPEYEQIAGRHIAVVTSMDDPTLSLTPGAATALTQSVSRQIASDIPNVTVVDPEQLNAFLRRNPYWVTMPYGEIVDRLKVDRLIHLDVTEYTTHEPGNTHMWRGRATLRVNVIEAESEQKNEVAYSRMISTRYPPSPTGVGVVDSDAETISTALNFLTAKQISRLFHQHERIGSP